MSNSQSQLQRNMHNAKNSSVPASPQQQHQQQQQPQNHAGPNVHGGGVHPGSVMQAQPYGFYPQPAYFNNAPYLPQQLPSALHYPQPSLQHPHQHPGGPSQQGTPQSQASQQTHTPQQNQAQQNPPPPPQASNTISPSVSRKRRASEIEDGTMPPSLAMSPYSMAPPQALMTPQQATSSANAASPSMTASGSQPVMKVDTSLSKQAPQSATDTDSPSQDPNNKKGRTNTPWTPQEESRLKQMRDDGAAWSQIAKTFPQRTEGSVKKHWYKDMHWENVRPDDGNFTTALTQAIKDYENNRWKIIGKQLNKTAKQCEQFAKENGLAPAEYLV